ncbi:MAG: filamentous hemagglutinin N-terminal domain-containing protein, partial [Zoogloea sp.]|uniref:two-partner secretion domain-containing protein n=1 Tax=Zoogloea sp. TaxID=49181 RepID=UPI003F32B53D
MNHNYRLVWNALNECWVVTHEHARGRGKQGRSRRVIAGAVAAALVGLASPAASVFALPVGEQVTQGSGTVSRAGNTLNVNQTSQRLAINWSSFNIGASETVNFVQPNASAVALNRVLGSDPSQIYGKLNANGQVFLINPNGILFGQSAQVNVGGLVASSLNLSDSDFMAGKSTFSGAGSSITNLGSVTAKAGGYVAFLGGQVSNQGTLVAHLGTVALAAGKQVSLDFAGDKLISVQVDQGTLNALAENKQLIQADGGTVILSAKTADALVSAVVNNTGIIQAQTVEDHAGTIRLLGDMEDGITKVSGTLDASAPGSGNGGFIETSAATVKIADSAKITTKSALGKNGKWLIDPVDFTIGTDITGATLSSQLGSGDIEIQSSTGHSGSAGNINVNDTVNWSANTLTLNAYNNININSVMNGSGTAKLALKYGQGAVSAGNTSTYNVNAAVNLSDGDNFSTQKGSDGDTVTYHVISSLSDLQNVDLSSSNNYALGHNIDATDTASWNSGAGFQPLNSTTWTGTLDGLGHTVSHLTINRPTEDVVGPFQNMASTATLKNIGFTDVNITGRDYTGGIAGIIQNSATVYNSYTSGSVSGRDNVGGIAGIIQYWPTIDHNYSSANVSAASNGGGLVGITYLANITNSHASGNVTSINTDMDGDHGMNFGGLVGYQVQSSITGSYATGNVYSASGTAGNGRLGGLVGRMDDSQITNSYATGFVDARAYGGDYGYDSGGLVGLSLRGVVNACFATGQVSGRSTLGGLMGISNSGSIDNSYATGTVTGNDTVGGFIGRNGGVISSSYSTGEARAASGDHLGKFAGDNLGSVDNSVYFTTTPGSDWGAGGGDNSGISGYDATSLKQASNFSAWDRSNTWVIFEGQSSPLLRGLMKQLTVTTNDVSKTYDAQTLSGTPSVTYSSAFDASDLTGTLTYSDAGASATNAGRYALNTTGLANTKFSQLESYNITYVASTLTINKAHLEVSTSNVSKTYDGTTNAAGSLVAVNGTQLYGSDSLSGGAFAFTDKNAGTGNKTVTVSSASINDSNGGGNYDVTYVDNTTSTITPKAITQTGLSV